MSGIDTQTSDYEDNGRGYGRGSTQCQGQIQNQGNGASVLGAALNGGFQWGEFQLGGENGTGWHFFVYGSILMNLPSYQVNQTGCHTNG